MWVRGLKQEDIKRLQDTKKSHPMWVRGLKLTRTHTYCPFSQSHPMWVRGLKLLVMLSILVWLRRTPCGCVD